MEKILSKLTLSFIVVLLVGCELNTPDISYNDKAGSERYSHISKDNIIDKKGVFVFQLESKNDDSLQFFDSNIKGIDDAKIEFKEKFKYRYAIGDVDSIRVKLIDPNGAELFSIEGPYEKAEYVTNKGIHTLVVENLRESKGIRKIFSKPNYDSIYNIGIYNAYNDVIYTIITEDECRSCNIVDANLNSYELSNVDFDFASFQNTELNGANLSKSNLSNTNFLSAKVDSADLSYSVFDTPVSLRLASFYYTNAKGITIRNADLDNTVMWDCDLSYSTITGSRMDKTDFFACNMKHSNLTDNIFENSSLEDCQLDSSDITGTSFCNTVLTDVSFYYTKGDQTTKCVSDTARGTW